MLDENIPDPRHFVEKVSSVSCIMYLYTVIIVLLYSLGSVTQSAQCRNY